MTGWETKIEKNWMGEKDNKIYSSDGSLWAGRGANLHDTRSFINVKVRVQLSHQFQGKEAR